MIILQQDFSYHRNLPILVIITFLSTIAVLFIVDYDTIYDNTIYAFTDQNNPVLKWNTFTTNASLEHQLSPPALARAYALVHVSIYDALLSSKNVDSENFTGKEKEIVDGAASEVLSFLYPDMKERIDSFSLTPRLQSKNNAGGDYVASDAFKAFQFSTTIFCRKFTICLLLFTITSLAISNLLTSTSFAQLGLAPIPTPQQVFPTYVIDIPAGAVSTNASIHYVPPIVSIPTDVTRI